MNLETIDRLATQLQEQVNLANSHYYNALDASGQLVNRQTYLDEAVRLARAGNFENAFDHVIAVSGMCPRAESIAEWARQAEEMRVQNAALAAELREAIAKAAEVERTRVTHGGEA